MTRSFVASPNLALAWLLAWTLAAAVWFVSPYFPKQLLGGWQAASGGWLSVTLLASFSIGLVQLAIIRGPGRQTWAALGWQARQLLPAAGVFALLWLLMQGGTLLGAWLRDTDWAFREAWAGGLGIALGPLLAQLLGTALMEETVFRGYLWPQIAARLGGGTRGAWLGALASQALFALVHLPMLVYRGATAGELAMSLLGLFVIGLVFVLVYAATRNLFIAVGVHALGNAPSLLLDAPGQAPTLWLLGGTQAVAVLAYCLRRKAKTRLSAGPLIPARGEASGLATNWSGR